MPGKHQWDHGNWEGQPPWKEWDPELAAQRRQMGRQFGCFVLSIASFFVLLTVGVLLLIGRALNIQIGSAETLLVVVCLVPLTVFAVLLIGGAFIYQRIGSPVADMMAAADAIAAGDRSVRVPERTRGNVGRLAARFNNMTAELERSEQQRRNLTADVAHELRTPLHIIQGNLEGVLDGVYEPTPEHIAATLDEAQTLTRLVNDLQLLSLAEAGQLILHKQDVHVTDLLEDVAERFAPQAAELDVALEVTEVDKTLTLHMDDGRIEQVLANLVGNSLRYTPEGGRITLAASRPDGSGSTAEQETITLSVTDTGAGIAPEDLPYIFDRFWRGDRSRTRIGSAGSGLGLAIARQLVLAHGGKITAESEVGVGTTFTIRLPAPAES